MKLYLVIMTPSSRPSLVEVKPLDHYTFANSPEEAAEKANKKWQTSELVSVREVKEEEMEKLVIVTDYSKINNGW